MKRLRLITYLTLAAATAYAQQETPMKLWYGQPATYFEESLPIGNGKLGALVYGGTDDNIIHLNDITFWTGKPVDPTLGQGAAKWLPEIRQALFAEDYARADSLQLHLQGPNSQFYQPLGTLHIKDLNQCSVSAYRRQLSLDSAIVTDSYRRGQHTVSREYFASHPDKLIAIRLRGDDLNLQIWLTGQTPHHAKAAGRQITMTGHAVGDPMESIHFCTMLKAETDGRLTAADSTLTVRHATLLTLYLVNETSFNGYNRHPVGDGADYIDQASTDICHTENVTYDEIKENHVSDYRQFFCRVNLRLWTDAALKADKEHLLPTDQLLWQYNDRLHRSITASRYLETLYFQYGRYLLISASRTPGVPANLQGLWTPHLWSPWRGNYTMNINLEENYWPAFVSNLAEMAAPLDDFIGALAQNGQQTARNFYGISKGWCASHNSDLWAMTNPVGEQREKPEWANWNLGGAWIVNTLWEHYLFTADDDYLRQTAYPLMKGATDFCLGWLIENPMKPGEMITAPSTSPENEYITDQGYHGMTCYGGTADLAIVRELLSNTAQAATIVGDADTRQRCEQTLRRLHPYTVGSEGDLNEWYHDWRDYDPRHRHQSHLIGLYPGNHLTLRPDCQQSADTLTMLQQACRQTLLQKGDQTTGWSTGWRINLWARLKEAEQAYLIYNKLLTYVTPDNYEGEDRRRSGGTYPNLMDAHPPFQIDGNLGGTAGVCEMLLQSGPGWIELLPALPDAWKDGAVKGLRARGGFTIDMTWADRSVTSLSISGIRPGSVDIIYTDANRRITLPVEVGGNVTKLLIPSPSETSDERLPQKPVDR